MAETTLLAESGRTTGSPAARRLRSDGRIPGVVYGPGVDPISVSVAARDLRGALSTEAGLNAVLSLHVDGQEYLTMARELQRHPVRGSVTHVDFQVVDPDREVSAEVPITLVGEAIEVQRGDGVLEQQMFSLTVRARPADIPTHLEVDISELVIGAAVRVSDLTLPATVTTDVDVESIIAAGQPPRVQVEEVPEGEAAEGEGAEGEAAEAEGGATAEAPPSSGDGSGGES
jgi:large subunit ribosomal protein L25